VDRGRAGPLAPRRHTPHRALAGQLRRDTRGHRPPDPRRTASDLLTITTGYGQTRGPPTGDSYLLKPKAGGFRCSSRCSPFKLKDGCQAKAEALVEAYAPKGPAQEDGTLSFRVYRDPANVDYLLFVEHFADQDAYDAHTGSAVYEEFIAGRLADLIVEFVEVDHELLVAK
jgi:quinol monooxygenase YgiN